MKVNFEFLKQSSTLGTVLLFSGTVAAAVLVIYFLAATADLKLRKDIQNIQTTVTNDSSSIAVHEIAIIGQGNDLIRHDSIIVLLEEKVISLESKVSNSESKTSRLQNRVYNLEVDMGKLLTHTVPNNNKGPIITSNSNPDDEELEEEEEEEEEPEEELEEEE